MNGNTLLERTLSYISKRRESLLNGGINSIPTPFKRFEEDLLGIELATYYCVTAATKGGKSQFASYFFVYMPLLYAYKNRDKIKVTIFYFALEETPERVMQRFMSYLLFTLSKGKIRISPKDLRSSKNDSPLSKEILDIFQTDEYKDILTYFEDNIIFSSTANPTGIYKECKKYAEKNGKIHTKNTKYIDDLTGMTKDTETFNWYEPDDPNEYKLIMIDHIGLVDTERSLNLKQSMDKLSEYLAKYLRNRYFFSPVVIQQQSFEGENNDSYNNGRIRPSAQGLGDSKYISRDCNILLGLFSPFKFEIKEYKGYDITKFRDNIRFLEVLVNRDGEMGGLCPLFFDGAVSSFMELPKPNDNVELNKVYSYIDTLRNKNTAKSFLIYTFNKLIKKINR